MNRRNLLKTIPAALAASLPLPSPAAGKKARLRTAICAYSYRDALAKQKLSYTDLVNMAVDFDVDGLDLTVYWFPKPATDEFLLPLKRAAYRNAVEIYSISISTNMCRPTPELQAAEVDSIKGWVDVAAKLGAGHIRVFGGTVPRNETEDRAAGWVAEILKRASDYSGQKGVTLGLENHGGITARAERIIQIVKTVNSPWVGINLDTGNFSQSAYSQIEMCLPYAVNSQVKVDVRGESGQRERADWDRIIRMFAASGYRGYFALEYEAAEDPMVAVPRYTRELNQLAGKYSG